MDLVKKYTDIYREIEKLNSDATIDLELNAPSEDVRDFYGMIENHLLQKRQKKAIAENLF